MNDFWKNHFFPGTKTEGKKANIGAAAVVSKRGYNRQGNRYGRKRIDLRAT